MDTATNKEAKRVEVLLHAIYTRVFPTPARRPAVGKVSVAQMRVLWILERRKSATPSEVAEEAGVSCSTMTELVERLVESGCIERQPSRRDRRQTILRLTPLGSRRIGEHARQRQARVSDLVSRMGTRDVHRMAKALETLNAIVIRREDA